MLRPLIYVIVLFLVSCTTTDAPCDYEITGFNATVRDIVPYEKDGYQRMHVWLDFDKSRLKEEAQDLGELQNIEIDSSFVTRNHITKGYIYRGTVSIRQSGDCDPMVLSFDHKFQ